MTDILVTHEEEVQVLGDDTIVYPPPVVDPADDPLIVEDPPVEDTPPPTKLAYLHLDPSGVYVMGSGRAWEMPENSILSPDQTDPMVYNTYYLVDGALTPRPFSPVPETLPGGGYRISGCPVGTSVQIRDLIGGEDMAEILTTAEQPDVDFEFPDVGDYEVEVDAPLPYVDTITKIRIE